MRGEKRSVTRNRAAKKGSPPHARGKVNGRLLSAVALGITPACAGKSLHVFQAHNQCRDHPRMRGEKRKGNCTISARPGSPPHARGKGSLAADSLGARGITPACAGKSRQGSLGGACGWDHPRMRGEKPVFVAADRSPVGSPPHARGKDGVSIHDLSRRGITPACAGKRYTRRA